VIRRARAARIGTTSVATVIGAAAVATVIGAAAFPGAAHAQPKGDPKRGEAKAEVCFACHGKLGQDPQPGMPTLAGQPVTFLTLQMILFREGLRDVPAMNAVMKGLSDQELADMAAYFASLPVAPAKAADRVPALYERGAALSKKMNCGSCHRPDYSGQNQIPRLSGQREDYLFESLKAFHEDRRLGTDTSMNGVLHGTTDADLKAFAHYFAQQQPK
jgi:cytochrome c553